MLDTKGVGPAVHSFNYSSFLFSSYLVMFQILTHLFQKIGIKTNNKIKKDKPKILYAFGMETENLEHFKLLFKSAIVLH